ncbi:MAG: spermidine/putrescine ABC transporter substrate-binding protein [Clostridiales bacterium]|nr:spermidine/putrescine ABC transporter substrate-binding protein [Clostridiales bacterium]
MKKITSIILMLLVICSLVFTSCGKNEEETEDLGDAITLYVYNWGEYISDGYDDSVDVNAEFEKYCREVLHKNVVVNYSTYSSNEDMYAKVSSGVLPTYDVIFPSDYMAARMISEGMLEPINPKENIENYENIDDSFRGMYYDEEEMYTVPYTCGTVGIIYNSAIVDEEDTGSWDLLWNDKYSGNIIQFNNPRDAFGSVQYYLSKDVNSSDENEWRECLEKLIEQKPILQCYAMDEVFNKMKGSSAAIAPYYAGDYFTMYEDNEDLSFYHPEEGTNIFVDVMCVPKNAGHKDLAIEYINFMLSEEIAVANAEYICYASPNKLVRENEEYIEYMTEEVHEDAMEILYGVFEDEEYIEKMQYYHALPGETLSLMNDLWEELKLQSNISTSIYIICIVIVVALVTLFVVRFIIKKKRAKCVNECTTK